MTSRKVPGRGLVAAALLTSSGVTLAACSDDAHPLSASSWVLTSMTDHDLPVALPTPREIRWEFFESGGCDDGDPSCPDGPKLVGSDACNDFTRSIRIESDEVVWGDFWFSTLALCSGGLADAMWDLFHGESFRYAITGDQMHVTSSSVRSILRFGRPTLSSAECPPPRSF